MMILAWKHARCGDSCMDINWNVVKGWWERKLVNFVRFTNCCTGYQMLSIFQVTKLSCSDWVSDQECFLFCEFGHGAFLSHAAAPIIISVWSAFTRINALLPICGHCGMNWIKENLCYVRNYGHMFLSESIPLIFFVSSKVHNSMRCTNLCVSQASCVNTNWYRISLRVPEISLRHLI